MCGIVGYISKNKKASPILLDAIKKLEYRGYDSVGIATIDDEKIELKKDSGKINEVDKKVNLSDMRGCIGIAHVRWATHGHPNKVNSHPHTDHDNRIAIVHNGIIENHEELKKELIMEGHIFESETDSEIIAHLIEKFISKGFNFQDAMIETVKLIDGSYAIGAILVDCPNKLIAIRNESPLVVGLGNDYNFIASDIPSFLKHTKKVIFPDDNELVIVSSENVTIKDLNGNILDKKIETMAWNEEMAQKEGYDHFMLKEINEESVVVADTLSGRKEIEKIVVDLGSINKICFVACGTSYHGALTGKYLFESFLNISTDVSYSSEFKYLKDVLNENVLTIFVSQSGETADTLSAIKMAKNRSKTLAIVNVLGSSITREADHVIYTKAGPEIAVAATKTYLSQLVSIYLLAIYLSKNRNNKFYENMTSQIEKVPDYINELMLNEDKIKEIANKYKSTTLFFFLGRGFIYPTALEGALKLKEVAYIPAEGYPSGELKHGPLALIDENVAVMVLAPSENSESISTSSYKDTINNMEEVKSRGAQVIAITSYKNGENIDVNDIIQVNNQIDELLSPLVYIVPLQLLSYYISIYKGLDPDKPKNLAKCVTVK
ncbi:MAG: glutamine--fructose-6-phosphate transaminase (isomerizing) [Methanobrevibacter sp.]|jgi:glucosamine--fructose-6-phosphate aminotransferase (isomerizing)|nr:glutamine--fructose-6-phosphate transaminase (isomerizing) [Candidatus Methanovirga basalitermitum]